MDLPFEESHGVPNVLLFAGPKFGRVLSPSPEQDGADRADGEQGSLLARGAAVGAASAAVAFARALLGMSYGPMTWADKGHVDLLCCALQSRLQVLLLCSLCSFRRE